MFVNVITMAGLGSRFRKVGYNVPKFMIEAKGKTLFEWSMESLKNFRGDDVKYIFISRKEDNAKDFIFDKCNSLGIKNYEVKELEFNTSGQAETAYLAVKDLKEDDEVNIYNIDTYIHPEFLKREDLKGDGCIPCFNAPGDHWSFAKTDDNGKVVEVREKVKISDNASLGVYYFKSAKLYDDIYNSFYSDESNMEKGERYIAPMYNEMIKQGKNITITQVPYDGVDVLGTPDELKAFIEK